MSQGRDIPEVQKKILDAAIRIISEKGIGALTVRNVCKEAGFTTGAFYHYFTGKEDLLTFIVEGHHVLFLSFGNQDLKETDPLKFVIEQMLDTVRFFQEMGIDFIREFFTPRNKSLDITYLGTSNSGGVVGDFIVALTNANMRGMFREEYSGSFSFVERLYKELNSIFYGCVFDWALADGNYDLEDHMRRMLSMHLEYYVKEGTEL